MKGSKAIKKNALSQHISKWKSTEHMKFLPFVFQLVGWYHAVVPSPGPALNFAVWLYACSSSSRGNRPTVWSAFSPAGGISGAYQARATGNALQFVFIVLGLERIQSPNNDWLRTEGAGSPSDSIWYEMNNSSVSPAVECAINCYLPWLWWRMKHCIKPKPLGRKNPQGF